MAPEVILAMDEGQYDGKVCHVYLMTNFVFEIVEKLSILWWKLHVNSKFHIW